MKNNSHLIPPTSPAFIIDQSVLQHSVNILNHLRDQSKCHVLYSIKALPFIPILQWLKPDMDGFSACSLFEAKMAAEVLEDQQSLHFTTPGIRADEITELSQLCSHISFNSITQKTYFTTSKVSPFSAGLRINPQLSFAPDKRFDPCRLHSKLGIDINKINAQTLEGISGLHVHTVFSQTDYSPLLQTLDKLQKKLGKYFSQLYWLNLGGGYLFDQIADHQPFIDLVLALRHQYNLQVYIEPGKAIVNHALILISTVLDCFESDGKMVAILDTSINHNPEVFEYQRQPIIMEQDAQGKYTAILTGSTCLAGDIFGEYRFNKKLQVGDKIHFTQLGAYTLVKANRFNGYNFPDIYWKNTDDLQCLKHYDYQNYRQQWVED